MFFFLLGGSCGWTDLGGVFLVCWEGENCLFESSMPNGCLKQLMFSAEFLVREVSVLGSLSGTKPRSVVSPTKNPPSDLIRITDLGHGPTNLSAAWEKKQKNSRPFTWPQSLIPSSGLFQRRMSLNKPEETTGANQNLGRRLAREILTRNGGRAPFEFCHSMLPGRQDFSTGFSLGLTWRRTRCCGWREISSPACRASARRTSPSSTRLLGPSM